MKFYDTKEEACVEKRRLDSILDERWFSDEDDSSELIDHIIYQHAPTEKYVIYRCVFLGKKTPL